MVQNWKRKYENRDGDNDEGAAKEDEDETLTAVELEERERLLNEGFPHWSFPEYQRVVHVLAGGEAAVTDYAAIAAALGTEKTIGEVRDYVTSLMERGEQCIENFRRIEGRIQKAMA
ncbi:hypothetical protein STCU_11277 [Strigomonas culicis]|uniref:Uncharacterized protein n=1 Tax=Strigomonas culicis TaxID=28005 RepID=S9THP5_9TRYP|nr:hypothetical protein STCU_11277 [Strigomonas culicis]|eukprot:EPY16429.1 hypothetical protein STCU_11277 [Strigomonas culicis]